MNTQKALRMESGVLIVNAVESGIVMPPCSKRKFRGIKLCLIFQKA